MDSEARTLILLSPCTAFEGKHRILRKNVLRIAQNRKHHKSKGIFKIFLGFYPKIFIL